ncbi:MAG: uracil phosphoribosyltransferase, partial [Candidatus Methanoperedens sp.]|nr:uracil phosphoribosyltransferase [Candidatus Methanoperedens sp.]
MLHIKDNLWIVDHPFAQQELTKIRDKNTNQIQFRKGLVRLGRICGYELMKILDKQEIEVETPLEKCKGIKIVDEERIVIINILRAAVPLVEGLLKAFPLAKQGVISAKRIEREKNTEFEFDVEINYVKIPDLTDNDVVLIADPMLASGSTLVKVIEHIN